MKEHNIDLYSSVAKQYTSRPVYPQEVFEWLASQVQSPSRAWDCACGSGQASQGLARHFQNVIATDISASQIAQANPNYGIEFRQASAEVSGLPSNSVDLINVGMAAHWFDLDRFYQEATRVAKRNATLALWVYGEPEIMHEGVNRMVGSLFDNISEYSSKERGYIKNMYKNLPFPFEKQLEVPKTYMKMQMKVEQLMAYLRSRSTIINYIQKNRQDPTKKLEAEIIKLAPDVPITVKWPLSGRAAHLNIH